MGNIPQPPKTRLKMLFGKNGVDVTQDITPDLLSFSYSDKESMEADEITLTLKDETGKWAGIWKPDGGEVIKAYILPGTVQKAEGRLYCGKFFVDEIGISGLPQQIEIKAVSIPLNTPLRKKLKTKAWESKDLKGIAEQIAKNGGLKLVFDSKINPKYERQDQSRKSDLKFLMGLCEEAGISMKVTDSTLVLFDQSSYEDKKPVATITCGKSYVSSYRFTMAQSDTYKSCTIKYRDPQTRNIITYTYVDPDEDENGQEYTMKIRATSKEEAERLTRAKLRKLNARQITGDLSVIGDIKMLAGNVIECKNFGKSVDGKYIIENANHTVSGSGGYTTSVALRKVNSKY